MVVNQQPRVSAAVGGPHGLTSNNTKAHYPSTLAARTRFMCDWHGWLSPWQQECRPWQMPREQLVGSGRLVSKQIYRQSSTTRPPSREGNDKKAIRVKENKDRIVGQRSECTRRERERERERERASSSCSLRQVLAGTQEQAARSDVKI